MENILKMFKNDGYENQLLWIVSKMFSEQTLKNIVNKCCFNVLCMLFITHVMLKV